MQVSAINIILSFAGALVFHEIGHVLAARACQIPVTQAGLGWGPKVFAVQVYGTEYHLRLLPLGAYVRLDMAGLQRRPLSQQLSVLFAGIVANLILGGIFWGTFFGSLNLMLAVANLFPLYQQDGWKGGMVIFRHLFGRPSPLVEWSFTLSAGLIGLALIARPLFGF